MTRSTEWMILYHMHLSHYINKSLQRGSVYEEMAAV